MAAGVGPGRLGNDERLSMSHHSKQWSAEVTRYSDAMDLQEHIFESDNPEKIAKSLKKSAEESTRRKASPFRSAMSMLTFYINRAGRNLSSSKRETLEEAKGELRKQFGH